MFEGCRGCCLTFVVLPMLCCVLVVGGIIYIYMSAPEPPVSDNFKPNTTEAQAFENTLNNAERLAQGGYGFTIQFNERQISSWMSLRGEEYASERDRQFPFKNIQVGMDDNLMVFYAELDGYGPLDLPLEVVLEPGIDINGKLEFDLNEAHLGGINVPTFVLKNITAQMDDLLVKPFEDVGDYQIQSLRVANNSFTATGRVF